MRALLASNVRAKLLMSRGAGRLRPGPSQRGYRLLTAGTERLQLKAAEQQPPARSHQPTDCLAPLALVSLLKK